LLTSTYQVYSVSKEISHKPSFPHTAAARPLHPTRFKFSVVGEKPYRFSLRFCVLVAGKWGQKGALKAL
jgi:hypothetical protein